MGRAVVGLVGRRALARIALSGMSVLVALAGACTEAPEDAGDTIDVRRIGDRVEVRRGRDGVERYRVDVEAGARVTFTARDEGATLVIDAVATGPGVPITATVRVEAVGQPAAVLEIRNDLVTLGDVTYRLATWEERNEIARVLATGPTAAALRALAPYRDAIAARLAAAAPIFAVVGLFQAWPDGVEPAWPALDDPRDVEPPGHLDGDLIGLGMTCSTAIRCPNSAPFCVTVDHGVEFGTCTRACASDDACGGLGRCAQPVVDIPDVSGIVLTCEIDCVAGACPGLLACAPMTSVCEATQAH